MVAVYPNQLAQRLNPLPPLVLLWGDDAGTLRQAAQQVIHATGVDIADPFAAEKITLTDLLAVPSRLADSAQTMSFTSPHRLIHITGISGEETSATLSALTLAIKTALEFPLSAVTIVLAVPRCLEKSSTLVKLVEAHTNALSVRFFLDNAGDLNAFLRGEFQAAGVMINADALQAMASGLGADRELARREVEKVILYAGEESPITFVHVLECLAGAIPADAFRLAEAVGNRNRAETDRLLQVLIHQGEDLTAPFSLVLRHLQSIRTAQGLKSQNQPDSEVLKLTGKLKAPRHVQQEFLSQVNGYPSARLGALSEYASDTLSQARGGYLDPVLVLSRAILGLSA